MPAYRLPHITHQLIHVTLQPCVARTNLTEKGAHTMINEVMDDLHERMKKTCEALRLDLQGIRTGRASTALVEHLAVEYYGVPTPLLQLSTISVPEAQMIAIRPFSNKDIGIIEKAISKSDIGLTPNNDGSVIRLIIPPLNEQRRKELVKQVDRRGEEARVSVRNIRRDAIQTLRDMEKEKMISEDELHGAQEKVEKHTHDYMGQVCEQ
jgi:ribosome recycling factor